MVDIDFLLYNRISFSPFVQGEEPGGGGILSSSSLHLSHHPLGLEMHLICCRLSEFVLPLQEFSQNF